MYPPVTFNNSPITKCPHQKHLGVIFDSKLDFSTHVEQKVKKCYKIMRRIKRLSISLAGKTALNIYKSFDILYDKPENQNFENKL